MPPVHATQIHRDTNFRYSDEPYVEKLSGWRLGAVWLALCLVSISILVVLGYGLLVVFA